MPRPLILAVLLLGISAIVWIALFDTGPRAAPVRAEPRAEPEVGSDGVDEAVGRATSAWGAAPQRTEVVGEDVVVGPDDVIGTDPAESPVLVSGRVVDDRGVPVAGALVRLVPDVAANEVHFDVSDPVLVRNDLAAALSVQLDDLRQVEIASRAEYLESVTRLRSNPERSDRKQDLRLSAAVTLRLDLASTWRPVTHDLPPGITTDSDAASTRTAADGTFELRGAPTGVPMRVQASADLHVTATSPGNLGTGVVIELRIERTGGLRGDLSLPDWLPREALDVTLRPRREGLPVGTVEMQQSDEDPARLLFHSRSLVAGEYDFELRLRNLPAPLIGRTALLIRPGEVCDDPRLQGLSLRERVFRYLLRAVDEAGRPLRALSSPLLARVVQGEDTRVVGFPWQDGRVEVFTDQPRLEVTTLCAGYRRRSEVVPPGERDLVFRTQQPVEVVLPGLRRLAGPDRKIRVSMILTTETGLPTALTAIDQRTGEAKSMSRWHLGKSGGAWLGESDTVLVPLVHNGVYQVIVRVQAEEGGGESSLTLGETDVVLDGPRPHHVVVPIDPTAIAAVLH